MRKAHKMTNTKIEMKTENNKKRNKFKRWINTVIVNK